MYLFDLLSTPFTLMECCQSEHCRSMLRGDSVNTFFAERWGEFGAEMDRFGEETGEGQRLGELGGEVYVCRGEMKGDCGCFGDVAGELFGEELRERTGEDPRLGLVGDELLLGEESGDEPWSGERSGDEPLLLSGEPCMGGVSCGEELLLRRVSGEGGVGLERRGGTGEVAGLDEAELGLEGRLEGLDDLLPELSREFLLKRPVLRGQNKG